MARTITATVSPASFYVNRDEALKASASNRVRNYFEVTYLAHGKDEAIKIEGTYSAIKAVLAAFDFARSLDLDSAVAAFGIPEHDEKGRRVLTDRMVQIKDGLNGGSLKITLPGVGVIAGTWKGFTPYR